MNLFAFALLLLVLMATSAYVALPVLSQVKARKPAAGNHERSVLTADYERTLTALQELDFDHTLGKVPAEDYPPMRQALLQQGADLLRRLDALGQAAAGRSPDRLEAAIAARRAQTGAGASDDEIESLIAARRKARPQKPGGFCPKCGRAVLNSDRFCPACGKAL